MRVLNLGNGAIVDCCGSALERVLGTWRFFVWEGEFGGTWMLGL